MTRTATQLREDTLAIWRAGVAAVDSTRLVLENVAVDGSALLVGEQEIDLTKIRRIIVVGAGKAGAGMAAGLEQALGTRCLAEKEVWGWLNVPDDCVRSLEHIHLHGARPAGKNEPTEAGMEGAHRILDAVQKAGPEDLCICLLSGGGSALLPAPIDGITLADKLAVTKQLSGAGANIQELNTVRKQLSRIKGGGLARTCQAGQIITLVISDVIGDPLDVIASGPTIADSSTPADALAVLDKFDSRANGVPPAIFAALEAARDQTATAQTASCPVTHLIIGNNATAVDAAGMEAERRGYSHAMSAAQGLEGAAEDIGYHLANMARRMRSQPGPDCLITGGEPTVTLVDAAKRGRGGRNQQLALAALERLTSTEVAPGEALSGIALLAGGTDGEDGPTDAAGAMIDAELATNMERLGLAPQDFLERNDAYHFFEPLEGLIRTGPTHTNVCDIRVVTVDRVESRMT